MPRTLRRSEYWSHITAVGVIRESTGTHGDSTLATAAITVGQTAAFAVASGTNFAANDLILVDTAELLEVNAVSSIATNDITPKYPFAKAHAVGVQVVEATRTVLGDITDGGVRGGVTAGDFQGVRAATKRLVDTYLIGHIEQGLEFEIENFNMNNIAAAMGIPESKITGAGSAASPYRLVALADDMNTEADQCIYFTGALKGGGLVEVQGWGAEVDPTAFQQTYQRGQVAVMPMRCRFASAISYETY